MENVPPKYGALNSGSELVARLRLFNGLRNQTVSEMKLGARFAAPIVVPDWRARQESNL